MAANHCKDLETKSNQFLKSESSDYGKHDLQGICGSFREKKCVTIDLARKEFDNQTLSQVLLNQTDKNDVILVSELTYLQLKSLLDVTNAGSEFNEMVAQDISS